MDDKQIDIGDSVAWTWGFGIAEGVVTEIILEKVKIYSNGKLITRNGSPQNPALIISHKSGNKVLKLSSEVSKTS